MKINVASWNIWVYGSRDFKGIASLIRENNIDIIGIQEAAIYHDKDIPVNSAEEIAKELNYNFVFFPSVDARPRKPWILCNAILSRFPIVESSSYPLNLGNTTYDGNPHKEQRTVIYAKIQIDSKVLSFFTTHLQFSVEINTTEVRLKQVQNLLSILDKYQTPIILTGDFNSTPDKEEIKIIENKLKRLGNSEPTWTVKPGDFHGWKVDKLDYRIDNIFVSKDVKTSKFQVFKSYLSDHLPIKTIIKV